MQKHLCPLPPYTMMMSECREYCPQCMCNVKPRKKTSGLVGTGILATLSFVILVVILQHVWGFLPLSSKSPNDLLATDSEPIYCAWGGAIIITTVAILLYSFTPSVCPRCGSRTRLLLTYRKP